MSPYAEITNGTKELTKCLRTSGNGQDMRAPCDSLKKRKREEKYLSFFPPLQGANAHVLTMLSYFYRFKWGLEIRKVSETQQGFGGEVACFKSAVWWGEGGGGAKEEWPWRESLERLLSGCQQPVTPSVNGHWGFCKEPYPGPNIHLPVYSIPIPS